MREEGGEQRPSSCNPKKKGHSLCLTRWPPTRNPGSSRPRVWRADLESQHKGNPRWQEVHHEEGGLGAGTRSRLLSLFTPTLPEPKDHSEETPRIPLHPIIPVDSSKEPLPDVLGPLAPAATPESWRRGPSGPCNASDTCSRFPPSLPGAVAPALLFVLLLWAFPFLLARVSVEPGLARPFALPQECTQGLGGFPYHNVGGEGAPS